MPAVSPVRRAFTLIEILIVVVLLGVLAAMVMPRFVDATDQVEESAIRNQLTEVRKQIRYYYFKTNAYPADVATLVTAGYLDKEPLHPAPGNYNYNPATGEITSSRDAAW
jgi:general secretion pathway protein G